MSRACNGCPNCFEGIPAKLFHNEGNPSTWFYTNMIKRVTQYISEYYLSFMLIEGWRKFHNLTKKRTDLHFMQNLSVLFPFLAET